MLSTTAALSVLLATSALAAQPPAILYHFGKKALLEEDARQGNVPLDAWNRFVMGPETTWSLMPFRRGLYGSSHPSYSDYFGDRMLENGQTPWMMAIHVSADCRRPERVADIATLPEDPRFAAWMARTPDLPIQDWNEFSSTCYRTNDEGIRSPVVRMHGTGNLPETTCESMMNRFLVDARIAVAVDSIWPESWYIRDRDCIEKIDGTAEDLIPTMAGLPDVFREVPDGYARRRLSYRPRMGASDFSILVEALSESSASEADLKALESAMVRSDLYAQKGSKWVPWIRESGPSVLAAYRRCLGRDDFKKVGATFMTASRSRDDGIYGAAVEVLVRSCDVLCRE